MDLAPTNAVCSHAAPVSQPARGVTWRQWLTGRVTTTTLGLLVALFALSAPAPAAAAGPKNPTAPSTAAPRISNPPTELSPANGFDAVSCSGPGFCEAVGREENARGIQLAFAASRSGDAFKVQKVPQPSGVAGATFAGVSCPSTRSCVSVGYSTDGAGNEAAMAASWNGTTWALSPVPVPAGTQQSTLPEVDCTAPTSCLAIGFYLTASTAGSLAEAWNGSSWTQESAPPNANFTSISCMSSSSCMAVGDSNGIFAPQTQPFFDSPEAELWNGTTWTFTAPATPSGTYAAFNSVSCTATACVAVGFEWPTNGPPASASTLAETWNGTSWAITTPAGGKTNSFEGLTAISCQSAVQCTAVGIDGRFQTPSWPLGNVVAESWNGTSWTTETDNTSLTASGWLAVDCNSASKCTAVGQVLSSTATEALAGDDGTWAVMASPDPVGASPSALMAVSCPATATCLATGGVLAAGAFADSRSASTWSLEPQPPVATGDLTGVSCPADGSCVAVGINCSPGNNCNLVDPSSSQWHPIAESWNGTSWTDTTVPVPAGSDGASLMAISCHAVGSCIAVGTNVTGAGPQLLAESWNGTTWSIQSTPVPTGATTAILAGVSCLTTADTCMAVGNYATSTTTSLTLAESFDGTSWTVQSTPTPAGTSDDLLDGVSCPSSIRCTAVGSDGDSESQDSALADAWDGTTWSQENIVVPTNSSRLLAVSCPTMRSCTAVGGVCADAADCDVIGPVGFGPLPFTATALVEEWNGTAWSSPSVPNPAPAADVVLGGVSCTAARSCTAVGAEETGLGYEIPAVTLLP